MEEWLRARLLAAAGLTALVATRVDWGMRSQGASLPAVTLQTISDIPEYTMAGASGWSDARIQIDCWGSTFAQAKSVRKAVFAVVHLLRAADDNGRKYRGFVIDASGQPETSGPITIHRAQLDLRLSYQS